MSPDPFLMQRGTSSKPTRFYKVTYTGHNVYTCIYRNVIANLYITCTVVSCTAGAVGGRSTADCMPSFNNPIVMRTCTLEARNTALSVNIPCMSKLHCMFII